MNNVLLDDLPTEWHRYKLNTGFEIGIQLMQVQYDNSINEYDKADTFLWLLFGDCESLRDHPEGEEFVECFQWFLNGWFHDNPDPESQNSRERVVDYDVDQWRIYADFRQIYGIDLAKVEYMHWWMFSGLLWNMPYRQSSFLQVVQTRQERPRNGASAEERRNLSKMKKIYAIEQLDEKKEYTEEEKNSIDEFDRMMEERRGRK